MEQKMQQKMLVSRGYLNGHRMSSVDHPQAYPPANIPSKMSSSPFFLRFFFALPALLLVLAFVLDFAQSCGFPPPAPAGPTCCCGGCGGRKKREAVQPHYKGAEVPCPQTEWKPIIEGSILADDDQSASLTAIQNALFRRFPSEKFLVICASARRADEQNAIATKIEAVKQLPQAIHFSSAGDGYCNVLAQGQWCQAVALSA